MTWRVLLTAAYALACGAVMALGNSEGVSDVLLVAVWLLAPVVGFLVGQWWVVLAVLGPLVGRMIGWGPAEHDGNSALSWPYVVTTTGLIAIPLLLGVWLSGVREGIQRRRHA
jgi:hypothetical protein